MSGINTKIGSVQCTSTNVFYLHDEETNSVFTEFLEKLMKSYRKSKQCQCQHMADMLEDEMHFEALRQFILNLAIV